MAARMDDEVFVTVTYEPQDFVDARRLALLARARQTNVFQLAAFVTLGGVGLYFFAPGTIGRIFASLAGALVMMVLLLVGAGWLRAAGMPPPKDAPEESSFEISDEGVVMKVEDRYRRVPWSAFDRVSYGQGVFAFMGKATAILPTRFLRPDQIEQVRLLALSHEHEMGASDGEAPPASAEENDSGDRSSESKRDD